MLKCQQLLLFLLINVKMPTIVGILTFMSRKYFMYSWFEYQISFMTSGPAAVEIKWVLKKDPLESLVFHTTMWWVCLHAHTLSYAGILYCAKLAFYLKADSKIISLFQLWQAKNKSDQSLNKSFCKHWINQCWNCIFRYYFKFEKLINAAKKEIVPNFWQDQNILFFLLRNRGKIHRPEKKFRKSN